MEADGEVELDEFGDPVVVRRTLPEWTPDQIIDLRYARAAAARAKAARDAVEAEKSQRLMEVFREDTTFAKALGVSPVHVEGGPCVESAPLHETFLPAWQKEQITCEVCRVAVALANEEKRGYSSYEDEKWYGDVAQAITDKPDPWAEQYAKALPKKESLQDQLKRAAQGMGQAAARTINTMAVKNLMAKANPHMQNINVEYKNGEIQVTADVKLPTPVALIQVDIEVD